VKRLRKSGCSNSTEGNEIRSGRPIQYKTRIPRISNDLLFAIFAMNIEQVGTMLLQIIKG